MGRFWSAGFFALKRKVSVRNTVIVSAVRFACRLTTDFKTDVSLCTDRAEMVSCDLLESVADCALSKFIWSIKHTSSITRTADE